MTSLTEAATAAANAAAQALSSMQSRSSTGLESATRILKSPDVFTGEDPMVFQTWKFQFSSWLSFGDQRFQEVLEKVEALRDDPADTSSFTTEEKELSTKLYTVLATYLKGRCFNMVKAGMKAKNGFFAMETTSQGVFCRLQGRGRWLWLRHYLPTLHSLRRRAAWSVCWRLNRWCSSSRSHL